MSVVKCRRSALSRTSSGSPGSWIVSSPAASEAIFASSMSIAQTWWPWEAKQAAVTRPTQPTPTTPTGSRPSFPFPLATVMRRECWQDAAGRAPRPRAVRGLVQPYFGTAFFGAGSSDVAIVIISFSESELSREFETQ